MRKIVDNIKKPLLYCVEVLFFIGLGQGIGVLTFELIVKGLLKLANSPLIDNPIFLTFCEYIIFIGIWIAFIGYYLKQDKEKGIIDVLGRKCRGNRLIFFLLGLLIGFSTNFICGYLALRHGDIAIDYVGFNPLGTIIVFFAVLVQSGAEELLCRGLLYQKLVRHFGNGFKPIIISSLLFACLHLFNEGITFVSFANLILAGILPALMIYYFDSMWMCIAEHTAWNFTQNILLGLPNSGIRVPFSIFALQENSARDSFFYNVGFGIEGSAISLIVLAVVIVSMYLLMNKRHQPGYDVWQGISEAEIEKAKQEKEDRKTLKQIKKYVEKDFKKKHKKNPDYTYDQLLEYELKKEEKATRRMLPTMIITITLTLVIYFLGLPEHNVRMLISVLVGEAIGMAVAFPLSKKLSKRRTELLIEYLNEKIQALETPGEGEAAWKL